MDSKHHTLSVLMFPWLAHGHIFPFLELAKKLTQRNFYIYFCSTPINLCSVKEHFKEKPNPLIQLVELNLPSIPNLPPHYQTTKSLPPHLMSTLKEALDMAQPSFSNLLMTLKPDLVIYDFLQPWASTAASSQNIPSIHFLITGAATASYFIHLSKNRSVEFPFPHIYLHEHEENRISKMLQSDMSANRFLESINRSSGIVLIKTFREIEDEYIEYLSFIAGKEFIPVGPLVQETGHEGDEKQSKFIEWLSKKDESSAVFVSCGTEYFMSREEIEEIAYGLELSKVNFIWVIRFPEGENIRVDEVLPHGFLGRVGDRGLVVERWAPQAEILGHSSIGGFVSHCGWSSVMEGMKFGVPIIAMPMHLDQPLNARLVVELGVGMEIKRENDRGGRIVREEVAKVIDVVVMDKEGEDVRRRANELSGKIRKKGQGERDVVVEKLMKSCGKRNNDFDNLEEKM